MHTTERLLLWAVARQTAEGLRALAVQLETDASLTSAVADRMAIDFFQNRQISALIQFSFSLQRSPNLCLSQISCIICLSHCI